MLAETTCVGAKKENIIFKIGADLNQLHFLFKKESDTFY